MKRKKAIKHFNREWKLMEAYLKSYLEDARQEDLHQFRVQVKKLRAFFILLQYASHFNSLTEKFKPIQKIFKQAGILRNAYIKLKLATQTQANNSDHYKFIKKANRKFKANGRKYIKSIRTSRKSLKREIKPIKKASINLFFRDQWCRIRGLSFPLVFNKKMHNCRKQIKILLYNYPLIKTSTGISLYKGYLTRLEEAIGNWHDCVLSDSQDNLENQKSEIVSIVQNMPVIN